MLLKFNKLNWCILIIATLIYNCDEHQTSTSIKLETEIDTTIATIGDILHYHISISGLKNQIVKFNEFKIPTEMELRNSVFSQEVSGKFSNQMEVVFWDTGHITIPVIDVMIMNPDSSLKMVMQTEPQEIIIVSSTDPAMSGQMKPLKGPVHVSMPFQWKIIILMSLLISTLVIIIWLKGKYQKEKLKENTMVVLPPPDEVALKKIEKLKNNNIDIKEFYVLISYILREYVEHSLFFKTLEMTTREIEELTDILPFSDDESENWLNVLKRSDMIKYAKMIPKSNIKHEDLRLVEEFVHTTGKYWKDVY